MCMLRYRAGMQRRQDAQTNRAALLAAGERILTVDPEASLATIAAAAGLSRRTVYGHFPSRADLIGAIADEAGDRLIRMAEAIEDGEDPLTTIAVLVGNTGATLASYAHLGTVALRSGTRDRVIDRAAGTRERLIALLDRAIDSGLIAPGLTAPALLSVITGIQQGLFEAVTDGHLEAEEAPEAATRLVLATLSAQESR